MQMAEREGLGHLQSMGHSFRGDAYRILSKLLARLVHHFLTRPASAHTCTYTRAVMRPLRSRLRLRRRRGRGS
jgi:superfamily II DNA helicase RecQ